MKKFFLGIKEIYMNELKIITWWTIPNQAIDFPYTALHLATAYGIKSSKILMVLYRESGILSFPGLNALGAIWKAITLLPNLILSGFSPMVTP